MEGEQQSHRAGYELSHRPTFLDRPVALGLLACAAVGTAHFLGTGWISESLLGLPVGMWLIGGVVGGAYWREQRQRSGQRATGELTPRELTTNATSFASERLAELNDRARETLSNGIDAAKKLLSKPAETLRVGHNEQGLEEEAEIPAPRPRGTKSPTEQQPRIGVSGPDEQVEGFIEQVLEDEAAIGRYERLSTPVRQPEDCAKLALTGAVTFSMTGQTTLVLPELRGREAAWDDWSQRLALSYPAVFPARVDTARIGCGPVRISTPREARLVSRLAEATAVLSQIEARTGSRRNAEWTNNHRSRIERVMTSLARTLYTDWADDVMTKMPSPACRAAARGVGAWLSTWDGEIDPQERRQWLNVCASFLPDEPEAHLRLAAAQIGAYEDDKALPALRRAFELLRSSGELPLSDPLAFVMAEMEFGNFGSLALGRVAAGLAIAWATTPRESLSYLRDDLIDDLEHSGKLVGRDQDHAFLKRVMSHMDRLRSDTLPMRARPAA